MDSIGDLQLRCGIWLWRHQGIYWPCAILNLGIIFTIPAWFYPVSSIFPFGAPAAYFATIAIMAPALIFLYCFTAPNPGMNTAALLASAGAEFKKFKDTNEELHRVIPIATEVAGCKQQERIQQIIKRMESLNQEGMRYGKRIQGLSAYTSKPIARSARMTMLGHRDDARAILREVTDFLDARGISYSKEGSP